MRKFSEDILSKFTPVTVPEELVGLTAELLANLHDIVRTFGIESPEERVRRLWHNSPEVSVAASTVPENLMMVIIGEGGVTTQGAFPIHFGGSPRGGVIWDRRVRVEDVCVLIEIIDSFMSQRGFVDAQTGERRALNIREPTPKIPVAVFFADQGSAMPVLPGGPDADTLRGQFDRPDEVVARTDEWGSTVLCHKRDLDYIERRTAVAKRVLHEHGITTLDQIAALSMDDVLELREKISKEVFI